MKNIYFVILLFSLSYYGCVDAVTTPTSTTNTGTTGDTQNPTIALSYPLTNDTLQLGSNQFIFVAKDDVGVRAVELWIDSTFQGLVNYDATTTAPTILWTADSTYLGKKIKYFLRVYDTSGKSTDSPVQTNIVVAVVVFPPNAPTNLVLTKLSNTIVNLEWKHDYKNVDGFRIYKKKGETGIYSLLKEVVQNSSNTNDFEVDPAYVFFYKIVAFNVKGESSASNIVSTGQTGSGSTVDPPTNVSAIAVGSRKIILTWKDNSDNENYFSIERRTVYTAFQSIAKVPTNTVAFKDSGFGLVPTTEYYYRIKAISNNDSSYSNEVNATTLNYDLLAPSNFRALHHNSKTIRLAWTDNNTNEEQTIIERRTASSTSFTVMGSVGKDAVQFNDTDVVIGNSYVYRIQVTDNVNYSPYTSEVATTVQSALIIAPTNLQGYIGAGNVMKVYWTDNSDNETNFVIERASDTALSNFTVMGTSNENINEFDDAATVGQKTYAYRVRATDGTVFSSYSNVFTIKNPNLK